MLNFESCAMPSKTPAATARRQVGWCRYVQNTYVAATPSAVEHASDVISRACARMLGQETQSARLKSPAGRPYSRADQAKTASPPSTVNSGIISRASWKSSK